MIDSTRHQTQTLNSVEHSDLADLTHLKKWGASLKQLDVHWLKEKIAGSTGLVGVRVQMVLTLS